MYRKEVDVEVLFNPQNDGIGEFRPALLRSRGGGRGNYSKVLQLQGRRGFELPQTVQPYRTEQWYLPQASGFSLNFFSRPSSPVLHQSTLYRHTHIRPSMRRLQLRPCCTSLLTIQRRSGRHLIERVPLMKKRNYFNYICKSNQRTEKSSPFFIPLQKCVENVTIV